MNLNFALALECDVAFGLAILVGTQVVRLREVDFKRGVVFVMAVLLEVSAEIACQMKLMQVLLESLCVVEELFTEVTPGMRQDLSPTIGPGVTIFNMRAQFLDVVNTLLTNEDGAALETDFAEGLLMDLFEVAS